jgi:hypothetical protein
VVDGIGSGLIASLLGHRRKTSPKFLDGSFSAHSDLNLNLDFDFDFD